MSRKNPDQRLTAEDCDELAKIVAGTDADWASRYDLSRELEEFCRKRSSAFDARRFIKLSGV